MKHIHQTQPSHTLTLREREQVKTCRLTLLPVHYIEVLIKVMSPFHMVWLPANLREPLCSVTEICSK